MAAKKKTLEKEELVKLRERPMPSGNISLYLDYLKNGKRERETLGLFLVNAKTLKYLLCAEMQHFSCTNEKIYINLRN